jgi:hypothetical protein
MYAMEAARGFITCTDIRKIPRCNIRRGSTKRASDGLPKQHHGTLRDRDVTTAEPRPSDSQPEERKRGLGPRRDDQPERVWKSSSHSECQNMPGKFENRAPVRKAIDIDIGIDIYIGIDIGIDTRLYSSYKLIIFLLYFSIHIPLHSKSITL